MKTKSITAAPLLLIAVFGLLVIGSLLPEEKLGFDQNPYLSAVILQLIIFALPSLFFCTLRGNDYLSRLRFRAPRLASAPLLICAFILMSAGSALITYALCRIAPDAMQNSSAYSYGSFAMTPELFDRLYLVFAFALLPAITEEFLFRGIILTEYEGGGTITSALLSSLTFAMVHFSIIKLPLYFFNAVVLAAITYAARSVPAAMIVHAAYNVFILFFEDYARHFADKQNIGGILLMFLLAGAAIISAVFASFEASSLYRSYASNNIPCDYLPKKRRKTTRSIASALLSPAFLLLTALFIAASVITSK